MFPNPISSNAFSKQRGFLLPLALFILVVMGVLALTISRTSIQTQTSSVQELMNVQAFYAAESGAQRGMNKLYLPDSKDVDAPQNEYVSRNGVDNRCNGWSEIYSFTANGLKACTAEVGCTFTTDAVAPDDIRSFYIITSKGSCGVDQYRAERTLEVGSFMEGE